MKPGTRPVHPIREWLSREGRFANWFALATGVSPSHLSAVMHYRARASILFANAVEARTRRAYPVLRVSVTGPSEATVTVGRWVTAEEILAANDHVPPPNGRLRLVKRNGQAA